MSETKRGRGRPRSQEVIERDERIFQAIAGSDRAVTKYEIEAGTGIPAKTIYMSLRRLSLANRVSRVYIVEKQHYWSNRPFNKPEPTPLIPLPLVPSAVFSSPE